MRQPAVTWPPQVKIANNSRRPPQIKYLCTAVARTSRYNRKSPNVSTIMESGRYTDGIGQFNFTTPGEAGRYNIFRDVPRRISCGTVHLCGILPGKSAAAMPPKPTVSIDNDLPAGQATVPNRPADHKPPGRIDKILRLRIQRGPPGTGSATSRIKSADCRRGHLRHAAWKNHRINSFGRPSSYSTVTWVFPSGRRYGNVPSLPHCRQPALPDDAPEKLAEASAPASRYKHTKHHALIARTGKIVGILGPAPRLK